MILLFVYYATILTIIVFISKYCYMIGRAVTLGTFCVQMVSCLCMNGKKWPNV